MVGGLNLSGLFMFTKRPHGCPCARKNGVQSPHHIYIMPLVTLFSNTCFTRIVSPMFFMDVFVRARKEIYLFDKILSQRIIYLNPLEA